MTTGIRTLEELKRGDARLKRIKLTITSDQRPGVIFPGYLLLSEVNSKRLSFFCSFKFSIDEKIRVHFRATDQVFDTEVLVTNLHEQISSGKIMSSLPAEGQPFPARTFYRCFAKVLEAATGENVTPILSAAPEAPKESTEPTAAAA
jgi:hypothetical protein